MWFTDASRLALQLMGDAINANLFLLGFAWQHGLVPVSRGAITRAIELNGVSVDANLKAFEWGRHAAHDPAGVDRLATPAAVIPFEAPLSRTLDELIAKRVESLTDYQDAAYAARYRKLVDRVREVEAQRVPGTAALAEAVARYYYKLLAIKDEYEVARLYTRPEFRQRLDAAFEGDFTLKFHLAPPLLAKPDPVTGVAQKREYGPWMMSAFGVAGEVQGPARHGARRLRPHRGAAHGAPARRRLREDHRRAARETRSAPITRPRWRSRRSPRRSAATAT